MGVFAIFEFTFVIQNLKPDLQSQHSQLSYECKLRAGI